MKKLIALVLMVVMVLSLSACSSNKQGETEDTAAKTQSIAFVAGADGSLKDGSFQQSSYEGITEFCKKQKLEYATYTAQAHSEQGRTDAIEQAITDGYGVIVTAGSEFASAVAGAAQTHPEVLFLALDVSAEELKNCPDNLALVCYREEQAGYLAGYAVVKGGYTELGFLGGEAVPSVVRYGYGFVQGAEAAAAEENLHNVHLNYWYSGSFDANDEIATKADNWYVSGTQVIFLCGGGIYQSSLTAAEANECSVIGVDTDQSDISDCIITSAMKTLSESVQTALQAAADNNWKWPEAYAGTCQKLGAAENGIGLPMDSTHIEGFTQENYDAIYKALADGSIVVDDRSDPDVHPDTEYITVYWE